MNLDNISADPRVCQWFAGGIAQSTQVNYTIYMKIFCECAGKTPTELIEESIKETKAGLLVSERNTGVYITKYKKCLNDKKFAPKTQAVAISTVKSFYMAFDMQLPSGLLKMRKSIPLKGNQNFLNRDDIKKLAANAKNLRDKAIILCMVSSGMARNEILNLRVRDVVFDTNSIGVVTVRREKAQVDYTTFISPEATQALRNYFDERNRDEKLKIKGNNDYIFVTYYDGKNDSHKGQKLGERTFLKNFHELGTQLGYGNGEFMIKSRSHAFRKFFASTLENAGMPKNKIDFMLGHTPSGNDFAYFQTDIEKLKELYIKYLPVISFERTIEIRSLDSKDAERLETFEKENSDLKQRLNTMESKQAEEIENLKNMIIAMSKAEKLKA
jgi:integrase